MGLFFLKTRKSGNSSVLCKSLGIDFYLRHSNAVFSYLATRKLQYEVGIITLRLGSAGRDWTVDIPQRTNTENSKYIFPEKELRGHSPKFHIQGSVKNLYIPTIDLPILQQENM
jgi:hypothetical protein